MVIRYLYIGNFLNIPILFKKINVVYKNISNKKVYVKDGVVWHEGYINIVENDVNRLIRVHCCSSNISNICIYIFHCNSLGNETFRHNIFRRLLYKVGGYIFKIDSNVILDIAYLYKDKTYINYYNYFFSLQRKNKALFESLSLTLINSNKQFKNVYNKKIE